MKWELDNRTGIMIPKKEDPSKEISKAILPDHNAKRNWIGMRTVRDDVKICYDTNYYLAIRFNGQWRMLGIITNMSVIQRHLSGALANFHDAWLKGQPIDEPKLN